MEEDDKDMIVMLNKFEYIDTSSAKSRKEIQVPLSRYYCYIFNNNNNHSHNNMHNWGGYSLSLFLFSLLFLLLPN